MILYDAKGLKHYATRCRRPMFSGHRGRTWDQDTKTINDKEVRFWIDTTWGTNYYFVFGQEWYRIPHFHYIEVKHFFTKSVYLFLREYKGE